MPKRQKTLLDVRQYIEWVITIAEGHAKYGNCPAIDEEWPKLKLIGKAILRKHDALKAKGSRKDLYVEAS